MLTYSTNQFVELKYQTPLIDLVHKEYEVYEVYIVHKEYDDLNFLVFVPRFIRKLSLSFYEFEKKFNNDLNAFY
jgi:hypothetical protein